MSKNILKVKEKRFINDLISHITQKQIMKRTILSLVAVALATVTMTAQEALWSGTQVQSPVVNVDGTVTFSIFAPQAQKVQVTGTFLPTKMVETPMGKW